MSRVTGSYPSYTPDGLVRRGRRSARRGEQLVKRIVEVPLKTAARLLQRLQPGAAERAAHIRYHPTMTVTHGLPTAAEGGRRPGPAVPGLSGAFVAGDWMGAEGLLADAALASGDLAAQQILRDAAAEAA